MRPPLIIVKPRTAFADMTDDELRAWCLQVLGAMADLRNDARKAKRDTDAAAPDSGATAGPPERPGDIGGGPK